MRKPLLLLTFIWKNRRLPQYCLKVLLKGEEVLAPRGGGSLESGGCAQSCPALRARFLAGLRRWRLVAPGGAGSRQERFSGRCGEPPG